MENDLVLVDMNAYKTAQVLSSNIKDQFDTQLRPRSLVNETTNLDKLDDNLGKLEGTIGFPHNNYFRYSQQFSDLQRYEYHNVLPNQ